MSKLPHILVVDDQDLNIQIIVDSLQKEGKYEISTANDGDVALKMLESEPDKFDVIILDRIMPRMSGLELLQKMQEHEYLRYCPVIFQTAKNTTEDIVECLKAGAYYYLTKPIEGDILLSVVNTAVQDRLRYKQVLNDLNNNKNLMGLLRHALFEFKTIDEARSLGALISHVFPDPERIVMGLTELLINAIEHGNLDINYDQKSDLISEGTWQKEVEHRLTLPKYIDKKAVLELNYKDNNIVITINQAGQYFLEDKAISVGNGKSSDALKAALASIEHKDRALIINADARAPVQAAVSVLEASTESGFKNVTFATQAE